MSKLSNDKLITSITTLLSLLLIAKVISLVVWWYLPNEGVELNAKKSYQAKYQRVDFKNMLIHSKVVVKKEESTTPTFSINTLVLKGLYGSKLNGYAIISTKPSPVTTIVAVGEVYAGYKLKELFLDHVVLYKNARDYTLSLNEKSKKASKSYIRKAEPDTTQDRGVTREDIHSYSKNPSQIWRDIAIAPYKQNGKIIGFRVGRIKANSKMAELGLKVGDIIVRANNIALTSFNEAIKLYQNIDKIDTLALVVLRNNQEKEIIYEIH